MKYKIGNDTWAKLANPEFTISDNDYSNCKCIAKRYSPYISRKHKFITGLFAYGDANAIDKCIVCGKWIFNRDFYCEKADYRLIGGYTGEQPNWVGQEYWHKSCKKDLR